MKCEEFEELGLGLGREGLLSSDLEAGQLAAAIQHANSCPRCAALQESWEEAQEELQALREVTQDAVTPSRVEMRLRQEFRSRHAAKTRKTAVIAAWALAAAAVLVGAVSVRNWRATQHPPQSVSNVAKSAPVSTAIVEPLNENDYSGGSSNETALVADNSAEDFTLLPGGMPQEVDDGAIVRVRMQRGALGALGLPVNEERAGEWIQVDLLVGQDGQPQAVRLPQ